VSAGGFDQTVLPCLDEAGLGVQGARKVSQGQVRALAQPSAFFGCGQARSGLLQQSIDAREYPGRLIIHGR
jgi:predicted deacylase